MKTEPVTPQDALDYMADLGPEYDYARKYVEITGIVPEWLSKRVIGARNVRRLAESRQQSMSDIVRRIQRLKLKGIT